MFPRIPKPAGVILLLAVGVVLGLWDRRGLAQTRPPDLGCPPGPGRLDRHGDPLPDGAVARLGTVRLRHGQIISGAVFSGDGRQVIVSDFYSGVHVWDAATGKRAGRLFADDQYCHALAISPDGRTLAVAGGDLTVRLCDPGTGREIGSLPRDNDRLNHLAF